MLSGDQTGRAKTNQDRDNRSNSNPSPEWRPTDVRRQNVKRQAPEYPIFTQTTASSGIVVRAVVELQRSPYRSASIRSAPPLGVYVALSLTDPALWSGVIFVQKGPYASAILRFQIRFPPTYPDLPPLVTFTTDIFHPLIVPLTTYTFTTGSSDTDTVSATDEERLPPGGFSLRHGFPQWFGRAKRSTVTSASSSRNVSGSSGPGDKGSAGGLKEDGGNDGSTQATTTNSSAESTIPAVTSEDAASPPPSISEPSAFLDANVRASPLPSSAGIAGQKPNKGDVSILSLLNYIRSTFDDESVLNSVPLEAAGNPGAWHAWRSHQTNLAGALSPDLKAKRGSPQARPPGEWNWEGVWAKRTQTGIQTSYLESVLFGASGRPTAGGGDDTIRFSKLDHELLERLKEDIATMAGNGSS